jgi:hypothetical protein
MPAVDMQRPLSVPAVPAKSAVSSIMHEIEDRRGDWEEFALYLNLGALGLPDVGYIAVPVFVSDISEETEPRHKIAFRMCARRSPEVFPTFEGAIGIDSTGPSNALLWLGGNYQLPMRGFGGLVNETLARGAAAKTLENMLSELASAVTARVEKREMKEARYRLVFNTGD